MINIGRLRDIITIKRNEKISDGCGGYTDSLVDVFETWASVKPTKAKQIVLGQQVQQETTHSIICRYFEGLQNSDIVVFKDREFEIVSIINVDEDDLFYELLCKEIGN